MARRQASATAVEAETASGADLAVAVAADPGRPSMLTPPLASADAADLVRGFSALADPARLRALSLLAAAPGGEVCVCDLVKPLGKSQPTVSHHLKVLGDAGLVHRQRRGRWVWYSLDRERLDDLRASLDT